MSILLITLLVTITILSLDQEKGEGMALSVCKVFLFANTLPLLTLMVTLITGHFWKKVYELLSPTLYISFSASIYMIVSGLFPV